MSRIAHASLFLIYAALAGATAQLFDWLLPELGQPFGLAAAALAFVALLLGHEMLASRSDRLDLFEELHDLRTAHDATQVELGRLAQVLAGHQDNGQATALVTEMRLVRAMLGRLDRRPRETAKPATAKPAAARPVAAKPTAAKSARPRPTAAARHKPRPQIIDIVRDALANNRVDLYLQPIVTLPQRKVLYYECLSRIRDHAGKVIEPKDYLPVAEAAGMVGTIDNLLAFRCVQLIRQLRPRRESVAFFCNLSPHSLADEAFFGQFVEYLGDNPDLADNLIFEFAAPGLAAADPAMRDRLKQLADLGYRLSVDGVTSLRADPGELARRGVHFAKLDAAALSPSAPSAAAKSGAGPRAELNELRLAMAQSGIHLIVGKVEQEETVVDLLDVNVDLAQGFLFGRPKRFGEQKQLH